MNRIIRMNIIILTICLSLLLIWGWISVADGRSVLNKGDVCRVTLITGDVVTVFNCSGNREYMVTNSTSNDYQILKTYSGTYIVPANIDLRKFDIELFNIDYLINEGYYTLDYIPVIISLKQTPIAGIQEIEQEINKIQNMNGVTVTKLFSRIYTISAKVNIEDRERNISEIFSNLKSDPTINKIWLDKKRRVSLSESTYIINASAFWNLGYNGSGITIAILDTGIDSTHPDLDDLDDNPTTNDPKVVKAIDFTDDRDVTDLYGHGTHVASIAAGTGQASNYTYVGVAPKAYLWNLKVLNRYGWGYDSWIISAIEYATYGPDGILNTGDEADIISMSLGGLPTDGSDPLSQAVNKAVEAGKVVVVAAGNDGEYFTISTPGAADKAITVGASGKYDELAWFSSKGPTLDFRVKPDVVAPGVDIVAARASGTSMGAPVNDYYTSASGTSMATPHVAGAAALILQKGVPDNWTKPMYVKNVLISTAKDLNLSVYEQGGGRIDLANVLSTEILVGPSTVSFGYLDGESSTIIKFYNLNTTSYKTLNLTLEVTDISGNPVNAAYLNVSNITLPPSSSASVLLTVNSTDLPKDIYSGKLKVVTDDGRKLKVIFGFVKLNKIVIKKIKRDGSVARYEDVWMYRVNITSYDETWSRFVVLNESGVASVYVPDGYYNIWSGSKYKDSWVWTTKDAVPIFGDVTIVLDERDAVAITFDPNRPNQIIAGLYSGLAYNDSSDCCIHGWIYASAYPKNITTYVTPTGSNVFHTYEYYPQAYYNPLDDRLIDTPEWFHLFFPEKGISGAKHYVANYSQLVNRTSHYLVALVDGKAHRAEWASAKDIYAEKWFAFGWGLNIPQVRTEYISPNTYYSGVLDYWDEGTESGWLLHDLDYHIYYAGERPKESWNAQPFVWEHHIDRGSNWVEIMGHVFSDRDNHGYHSLPPTSNVTIYRDGVKIFNTTTDGFFRYCNSSEPPVANYVVVFEGTSSQKLAVRSKVVLSFTYSGSGDYKPPRIYFIKPELDPYNAINGSTVTIKVIDEDENGVVEDGSTIASVTLSYSLDDGATWTNVTLARNGSEYSGILNNLTKNSFVSFRAEAVDTSGNSAYYEITNALYVGNITMPKPAKFVSYFDDYGEDIDGDGLYNYLVIEIGVNVTKAGEYLIAGWLYENGTNNQVDWGYNETYLNEGNHVVLLKFDGIKLWRNRINGTYDLRHLSIYNATYDLNAEKINGLKSLENRSMREESEDITPEEAFAMYGERVDYRDYMYTTSYYNYTVFQKPPAELSDVYLDYGVDINENGLYDYLAVIVGVSVLEQGYYRVEVDLHSSDGSTHIVQNGTYTYLQSGLQNITILLDGYAIRNSEIDGPYLLDDVWLEDSQGNLIDYRDDPYVTSVYNYTDFEKPPAEFTGSFTDYGLDADGDGLYDYLVIEAEINVTNAGEYELHGSLNYYDEAEGYWKWVCSGWNRTYLEPGVYSIILKFNGAAVYDTMYNGSFKVWLNLYETRKWRDVSWLVYTTKHYNYTDFEKGQEVGELYVPSVEAYRDYESFVPIMIANVVNVTGINLTIGYNSSIVQMIDIRINDSFNDSMIFSNIDNINGTVKIALVNTNGITTKNLKGIVDLLLSPINVGSTYLNITDAELSNESFYPYPPSKIVNGLIVVTVKGDFNGNNRLDVGDVAYVAHMVVGMVEQDLEADFNNNGRVDIGDLAKIAYHLLGKTEKL